ncbi:MAG: ribosomal protein S18-alanine N-acetyltransferase [Thermoleophilaceae bacterium]|nr:ribosomal protein S18-alanine N-acetyltransferase [Thermoleophilaceae bacterium]
MNAQPQQSFEIQRMEMQDIADALKIEHQSFPTPWSSAMFVLELSRASSICLSAKDDDVLIGYMIAARYAQVWHIMNVSVDPANRRGGVGSAMIHELFRIADGERTHYTLEVRVSNEGAIRMYEECGFREAGVRPGYYADNREDALIMWRSTDRDFVPPNASNPTSWKGHR